MLGGEAACWGACMRGLVDADRDGRAHGGLLSSGMLEAVLAVAERLWSPEEVRDVGCAEQRIAGAVRWVQFAADDREL